MSNEVAERLRREMGVAYRIALLDDALAIERKATVARIRAALDAREHDREHPVLRWPVALHDILDAEATP